MATLEKRVEALELQRTAQWPRRPFASLTVDELQAELHRLDSGLPPSEAAMASMARFTKDNGNDES